MIYKVKNVNSLIYSYPLLFNVHSEPRNYVV